MKVGLSKWFEVNEDLWGTEPGFLPWLEVDVENIKENRYKTVLCDSCGFPCLELDHGFHSWNGKSGQLITKNLRYIESSYAYPTNEKGTEHICFLCYSKNPIR